MDLHTLHSQRGSLDNAPTRILYKHDGYSQDDLIGYAHETSPRGYQDVSQITAVQVTPRPKPRAFPRTNPAYVGVHRRDGAPSYKKINIETSAPPTAIYNQRFYEAHAHPPPHPSFETMGLHTTHTSTAGIQAGGQSIYHGEHDPRHLLYGRHERSDSDTSHSSYGRVPSEMTDSLISQSSGQMKVSSSQRGDHSDSHSSQGSLRNIPDSHSSQGSLRSVGLERDHVHEVSSSHSSPRHQFNNNLEMSNNTIDNKHKGSSVLNNKPRHVQQQHIREQKQHGLARHNSEPDYANLPIVAHFKEGKILTLDEPVSSVKEQISKLSSRGQGEGGEPKQKRPAPPKPGSPEKGVVEKGVVGKGLAQEDMKSADSLSPHEYGVRDDTPSSIRSHNSTSHTSEGA